MMKDEMTMTIQPPLVEGLSSFMIVCTLRWNNVAFDNILDL